MPSSSSPPPSTYTLDCEEPEKVRYWFTEGYEAATGQTIQVEESYSKQQAARPTPQERFWIDGVTRSCRKAAPTLT